jgi:diadenosine tetraphosphate (Ap4A) HIT family hydrolase
MESKVVNRNNARQGEYRKVIEKIDNIGKCPFCPDNFIYHKKPVLKRKGGWFLTENSWPYKGTSHHLIIIGKKHKEEIKQLTNKDLQDVLSLAKWAVQQFKIQGGALTMRFGNTNLTGASVAHIHFHIISPRQNKKTRLYKKIAFPIGQEK